MDPKLTPEHWGNSLFDAITELMATLDLDMRIHWTNQGAAELTKQDPQDLVGGTCYKVWHGRQTPCEGCPVQLTIQTGKPHEGEVRSPGGGYRYMKSYPLRSQDGTLQGIAEIGLDITERKQMEKELQQHKSELAEQESLYRSLVEDYPYFVLRFLPDTTITFANNALAKSVGYTPKQLKGRKWINFIPEHEREQVLEHLSGFTPEDSVRSNENSFFSPEGIRKWHSWTNKAFFDSQGELSFFQSIGADITERKQAEEDLRWSNNYYRAIFETSGSAMFIIEEDTTISLANSIFEEMSGYSRQEVEGKKSWTEFVHPDDIPWMQEKHYLRRRDPCAAPLNYEFRFLNRNQKVRSGYLTIDIIPDTTKSVVSLIDITERKQAEDALRESEEELEAVYDNAPLIMLLVDQNRYVRKANAYTCNFLQKSEQEMHEKRIGEIFQCVNKPIDSRDYELEGCHRCTIRNTVLETLQTGRSFYQVETGLTLFTHGEIKELTLLMSTSLLQHKTDPLVLVSFMDITQRKQTEKSLQLWKNYYRAIFETSGTAMFIIEPDTTISLANSNFAEISGYSKPEIEGIKSWTDFAHPEDVPWMKENHYLRRRDPTKALHQYEFRFITRSGERRYLYLAVDLIPGTGQSIASGIDITERKRAEELLQESEEQYRLLVENASEGIGVVQDDQFKWVNPRIVERLEYPWEELTSRSIFDFVHHEDRELVQIRHQEKIRGDTSLQIYPFRILTAKGEVQWCLLSVIDIIWENRPALLCFFSDISELKRIESELDEAKQRAEAANRSKSEFLANMSHEIRTPLNGVMGMLQLLQTSELNEQQDKYVRIGLDSTKRLNRLLTDILDLSKIEANKLAIKEEEFVLADVIKSTENIFKQLSQKNNNDINISLDKSIPERLIGDSTRLNQILFNLVGNANKYTRDGDIELEASLLTGVQAEKCRVLFVIADNGQGISEDRIDKIFDIFTQGSDTLSYTREFEGAGLGLPLVKRLVDLMNGSISISSKEGEGTSVYVSLPFSIPGSLQQVREELQTGKQTLRAKNSRVLLVDDDETTQFYIRNLLQMCGISTATAKDGKEALNRLEQEEFDCVLMDVQMPVLDGVEATRLIRSSNAGFRDIPVIAMTAYAMTGDREKFLEAGMDDYIAKPVDQDELLAVLEKNIL